MKNSKDINKVGEIRLLIGKHIEFVCLIKSKAVCQSPALAQIQYDGRGGGGGGKSQGFVKGRRVFQQFNIIKPLESNSSNRSVTLPVTGVERGWVKSREREREREGGREREREREYLFRALAASHCAGQLHYTFG